MRVDSARKFADRKCKMEPCSCSRGESRSSLHAAGTRVAARDRALRPLGWRHARLCSAITQLSIYRSASNESDPLPNDSPGHLRFYLSSFESRALIKVLVSRVNDTRLARTPLSLYDVYPPRDSSVRISRGWKFELRAFPRALAAQ